MNRQSDPAKDFDYVLHKVKDGSATDRTGLAHLIIAFVAATATVGTVISLMA